MIAPRRELQTARGVVELGERPWLMGVVNASPESFSDAGGVRTVQERVDRAAWLLRAGADLIDIGGESGVTNRPAVDVQEEIRRVVPLIERVAGELGALVSVDTYKPEVARAALSAGAALVNDVSGLRNPELAEVCADSGAALVLTHNRAAPKQKLLDPELDGRITEDIEEFLGQRIGLAQERGVAARQLILDPGPDLGKTPAQTVAALRSFERLHGLGRPLLLAVSRKDFVGAITLRPPRARLAGTLAAIAHGVASGAHILRVHDVDQVADFLAVQAVLSGQVQVDSSLRLADELRWEQG
ncbi:MAG TPA: dihydropteroate synthase [Solirubrobacteraceae bacterium]|nr:dihydropteroate synthase [Solirubrobacteraceae bacterium]